jgi:scyllo-inositol 2-dehydrogenase (NADP+)
MGPVPTTREVPMDVRFGVIGTSWITSSFVAAARSVPGVRVDAVSSRTRESAVRFAEANQIPGIHVGTDALAADPALDAVYLGSPNAAHAEQAIALLRAGKHVLVEKPMGTSAAQVTAMIAAARDAERLLMEAYVAPFQPNVAAVREALPTLGRLRRAVFVKDQYSSKYDAVKAGSVPNAFDPALGGGALMDLGIYTVSLAVHLFGEPSSVLATGLLLRTGVDGQGTVLLGYDGFEVACLHSKIAPCGIGSEIAGEDAVLTLDDCSVPTRVRLLQRVGSPGAATAQSFTREHAGVTDIAPGQHELHMRYEVAEFADLIRAGARESALHPPSRTLAALRILDEARRQVGVRFPTDEA